MVDAWQVVYEYTDGNSVTIKTDALTIDVRRVGLFIDVRVDGTIVVTDNGQVQRIFSGQGMMTGDDWKTLHDVQIASITYSGAYPRLTTINFDGDTTITNVEVAMTRCKATDLGNGYWTIDFEFTEKDQ